MIHSIYVVDARGVRRLFTVGDVVSKAGTTGIVESIWFSHGTSNRFYLSVEGQDSEFIAEPHELEVLQ